MAQENKYAELDKHVTKEIMAEFDGKQIESVCIICRDEEPAKSKCDNCEGKGTVIIKY